MEFQNKQSFVVIGGGIAGVSCSQELARRHSDENILLITATDILKESRSVMKVTENLEEVKVYECNSNHFSLDNPNITVIRGMVSRINVTGNTLYLQDGASVKFSKLCICTGARPKSVARSPNVITIRDLESVTALKERLCSGNRVLVVGNGGIAMELVHEVTRFISQLHNSMMRQ